MFYKFKQKVSVRFLLHLFLNVVTQSKNLRNCSCFFARIFHRQQCIFSTQTNMISFLWYCCCLLWWVVFLFVILAAVLNCLLSVWQHHYNFLKLGTLFSRTPFPMIPHRICKWEKLMHDLEDESEAIALLGDFGSQAWRLPQWS